jgi:cell wall assembly regulator SMI1
MKTPRFKGWRKLRKGEVVKYGDFFYNTDRATPILSTTNNHPNWIPCINTVGIIIGKEDITAIFYRKTTNNN